MWRLGVASPRRAASSILGIQNTRFSRGFAAADGTNLGASRPKRRLEELLALKAPVKFTFPMDKTVGEAISHLVEQNLGSSLAVDSKGALSGIFTARDILRFLHNKGGVGKGRDIDSIILNNRSGGKESALSLKVKEVMVKKEKLIFCSPTDSVYQCREIMFQNKIRTVPVIKDGEVLGIITSKDLADSSFVRRDGGGESGGKRAFLETSVGRKGLPEGTMIRPMELGKGQAAAAGRIGPLGFGLRLSLEGAGFAMPHPYKKPDGCAQGRRDYGPQDLCEDLTLCEDAHFVFDAAGDGKNASQTYLCVADGVGSWRQYGVDPRKFSHRLVENAKKVVESDALQRQVLSDASQGSDFGLLNTEPIHPYDVLADAWALTTSEKITGSATFCVATLDQKLNQLAYSNLGDSGLLVVRHVDSEVAGGLTRERATPRHLRSNDLKVMFMSQQQLRSFNLPYQVGYSGIKEHSGTFEEPSDANSCKLLCFTSAPPPPHSTVLTPNFYLLHHRPLQHPSPSTPETLFSWPQTACSTT